VSATVNALVAEKFNHLAAVSCIHFAGKRRRTINTK